MSHAKCSCTPPWVLTATAPAHRFCPACGGARHEPKPVTVGHAEAVSPTARVKVSFHPTQGWTVDGATFSTNGSDIALGRLLVALSCYGRIALTNQHRRVALLAMQVAMGMARVGVNDGFDCNVLRETQEPE